MTNESVESLAKVGLTLTTLVTVVLYMIGLFFYSGFFHGLGLGLNTVPVDFEDLIRPNWHSFLSVGFFVFGIVHTVESGFIRRAQSALFGGPRRRRSTRLSKSQPAASNADNGPNEEVISKPVANFMGLITLNTLVCVSLTILLLVNFPKPHALSLLLCVGFAYLGRFAVDQWKSGSWYIRLNYITIVAMCLLMDAWIAGYFAAGIPQPQMNVELRDGDRYERASVMYRSRSELVLIPLGMSKPIVIPNSDVRCLVIPE